MHLTRKDKGGIFAFVALILLYYDSWTMFVRPSIAKLSRAPRELARAGKFRAKEVYSER